MKNQYKEKDWKAYVIYCNDEQKNEFNIKESEHVQLINIFEDLPLKNINHINHHYSQIISMYYVWKNQLKSDYVCIWDHRRFFTPINFDKLDNDGIQAYFHVYTDMTPFDYMIHEGINEYIIYQFIKFMIEKYNIDHDRIIDLIYNKPWEDRLWLITGFNCNWKVFNNICDFTFNFVNYLIPNGDYENYDSIETWVQDMKLSMSILRSKSIPGEIIECGRIESEDRDIGNITECLYPLFCELMGYQSFTEWEDKHIATVINEYNKDTIYDDICKWVHKNEFNGCRDFAIITNKENIEELKDILFSNGKWYKIIHCEMRIGTKEDICKDVDYIILELNQYIDVNEPIDELKTENIKYL
jgi:hypothetical protein